MFLSAARIHQTILFTVLITLPFSDSELPTANLIQQGHFKKAKAALSAYLQKNPDNPRALAEMSKISVAYVQYDDGIKQAEMAVAAEPKNSAFHAHLASALAAKLGSGGLGMFEKVSLVSRYKKEAELALQLDPENMNAYADLVKFYLIAPSMIGGDQEKAKQMVDQLIPRHPAEGYLLAGRSAFYKQAKPEEVENFFRRAADAGPDNYEVQISLADFYLNAGNAASAEQYARKALRIDAHRVRAYTVIAEASAQQQNWKQLETVLHEAQQNVPDDFSPYYEAGKSILIAGIHDQLPRAEDYFRKYLTQEPEPQQPAWSKAHWRLGEVLEKESRKEEAKKELQLALRLEPNLKEASEDLKRLQ